LKGPLDRQSGGSESKPPLRFPGLCVTFLRPSCGPGAGWRAEPGFSTACCEKVFGMPPAGAGFRTEICPETEATPRRQAFGPKPCHSGKAVVAGRFSTSCQRVMPRFSAWSCPERASRALADIVGRKPARKSGHCPADRLAVRGRAFPAGRGGAAFHRLPTGCPQVFGRLPTGLRQVAHRLPTGFRHAPGGAGFPAFAGMADGNLPGSQSDDLPTGLRFLAVPCQARLPACSELGISLPGRPVRLRAASARLSGVPGSARIAEAPNGPGGEPPKRCVAPRRESPGPPMRTGSKPIRL